MAKMKKCCKNGVLSIFFQSKRDTAFIHFSCFRKYFFMDNMEL